MKKHIVSDFVVIGGGIIGLNIARSLATSFPNASIALLEKEKHVGLHTSGRNSGVIHAGIYYATDSFKAKFCREGNQRLTAFCQEHNLSFNNCGKLIVAHNK